MSLIEFSRAAYAMGLEAAQQAALAVGVKPGLVAEWSQGLYHPAYWN